MMQGQFKLDEVKNKSTLHNSMILSHLCAKNYQSW